METYPLVSILMTLYNREKYLASAIESVILQQYPNWELIIQDDCSTDNSYEIAKSFLEKDKRIKLFRNEKNLKQFPNRNKAASKAKGKYLKYLDSDDMIYPYSLHIMVEAMEKFPKAAMGFQHRLREDNLPYPIFLEPKEAYRQHFINPAGLFNCGPSGVIFRRDIFEQENGFTNSDYTGNDTELLIRMGLKYPCLKLAPALVWWRQHEDQAIKKAQDSGEYLLNEFDMQFQFLKNKPGYIDQKENQLAINFIKWKMSRKIWLELRRRKLFLAFKMYRKIPISIFDLWKGLFKHTLIK